MMPANVKLSKTELLLVCDEQFILTKNNIIDKVYNLFGSLSEDFKHSIIQHTSYLPEEVMAVSPKIYRGEQYKRLPYVLFDYPRYFNKENTLAIRCFFWWGNFFSITLHLGGKYMQAYAQSVLNAIGEEKSTEWYICINENQWEHHLNEDNYILADRNNLQAQKNHLQERSFFKIAKKLPLTQWDEANDFFITSYAEIMNMLHV